MGKRGENLVCVWMGLETETEVSPGDLDGQVWDTVELTQVGTGRVREDDSSCDRLGWTRERMWVGSVCVV